MGSTQFWNVLYWIRFLPFINLSYPLLFSLSLSSSTSCPASCRISNRFAPTYCCTLAVISSISFLKLVSITLPYKTRDFLLLFSLTILLELSFLLLFLINTHVGCNAYPLSLSLSAPFWITDLHLISLGSEDSRSPFVIFNSFFCFS